MCYPLSTIGNMFNVVYFPVDKLLECVPNVAVGMCSEIFLPRDAVFYFSVSTAAL